MTDEHGRLNFNDITWNARSIYKFTETAAPSADWVFNATPVTVNINNYMYKPNFDGNIKVRFENYPAVGSVIISKYERTSNQRLPGAKFGLYQCTKAEFEASSDPDDYKVGEYTTGENGFIKFDGLALNKTYVVKELAVPEVSVGEDPFRLNQTLLEFDLTHDKTVEYLYLYNVRERDLFDLPVKLEWLGEIPDDQEITIKLSQKDLSSAFDRYTEVETVTVTAGELWQHEFKDLYVKTSAGGQLLYKVEVEPVDGYRLEPEQSFLEVKYEEDQLKYKDGTSVEEIEIAGEAPQTKQGLLFRNFEQIDILVRKVWEDADSPSARPEKIQVQLYQNNNPVDENGTIVNQKLIDVTEHNGIWEVVYKGVDKTNAQNHEFTYTVQEEGVDYYYPTFTSMEGIRTAGDEPVDLTLTIQNTLYPQVDLLAKKNLFYKDLVSGEFTFSLYKSDATGQIIEKLPGSFSNDAEGNVVFSNVVRPATLGEDHAVYYVM